MKKASYLGILVLPLALSLLLWSNPRNSLAVAPSSASGSARIPVFFLGREGSVRRALSISPEVSLVSQPSDVRVVVIGNALLDEAQARRLNTTVQAGTGMVIFLGNQITSSMLEALLGTPVSLEPRSQVESIVANKALADALLSQITWNSAPQIRERSVPRFRELQPQALVQTYKVTDAEPVIMRFVVGKGTVYLLTPWLSERANVHLQQWPYFNYLVYHLTARAAGDEAMSFADYPVSPVPHFNEKLFLVFTLVLMISTTVGVFIVVRRYSLRHPEKLQQIVVNGEGYQQAETAEWEEIGFHRPLAGFLLLLAMGLVLFIPLMVYQSIVLPRFLLPSAQAIGITWAVPRFFELFWVLFDWGTSIALIKYFAEYRVDQPERGIKYVQLFVWWQAITGTIQLSWVALLAAFVVPNTAYAYLSYYFVIHAIIQFPGFLRVYQYVLRAFQRLDYDQILNILATLAPVVVQTATVWFMVRWGMGNPVFGEAMGGVFGVGLSLYLVEVSVFLVGFWLYRRLGYGAGVIFLAHFDWETLKRALRFGFAVTVAGIFGSLGWAVQIVLMERYLVNYSEVMGNWNVAFGLILAFAALGGLYQGMMPGISESFSHKRQELTAYYVAQGFKYGGWFSGWIGGALLAVCDRFILGSLGSEWARAAEIVGVLIVWGAVQYPAWFADRVQEGTGKPYLMALLLIMEQTLRIVLMFVFVPTLQLWGLILAYLIALPTKDVVAWLVNWKLIIRPRIYWWQSFVAPLLAAAVTYLALRSLGDLLWRSDIVASMLLFFIAILPSLPFFCFFNGLFGGWEDHGLLELRKAASMSSFARPFSWMIYWSTYWGARISPLHNRFPMVVSPALAEARSLTKEKVSLVGRPLPAQHGS